jgi:hypothetical protein
MCVLIPKLLCWNVAILRRHIIHVKFSLIIFPIKKGSTGAAIWAHPASRQKARPIASAKALSVAALAPSRAAADMPAMAIVTRPARSSALAGNSVAIKSLTAMRLASLSAVVSARASGSALLRAPSSTRQPANAVALGIELRRIEQRPLDHLGDRARGIALDRAFE